MVSASPLCQLLHLSPPRGPEQRSRVRYGERGCFRRQCSVWRISPSTLRNRLTTEHDGRADNRTSFPVVGATACSGRLSPENGEVRNGVIRISHGVDLAGSALATAKHASRGKSKGD